MFYKLRDKERSKESAYIFNLIFRIPLKDEADGMHLYREKGLSFLQSTQNIFHTQGGFSVLTLLAFGDEKYYICTEIWEEPRLPPFFDTFPLKSGILEAHPGKICLPLILICLPIV